MAVTYAPDAPEVETPEREIMFTVSSDALDAVVGDLEAYSQAPSMTTAEYAFDEPVEESLEILPDKRGLVLAAVFLFLEIVLVVETVFVVFESANNSDFVDSVASVLLGVALFANFVAGIAAACAANTDRRGPRNDPYEDDWIFSMTESQLPARCPLRRDRNDRR